jgi:tape measure domain-containing protein
MSRFNDLLISIGIDTKGAQKEIKKVEKMFDGLASSLTKTTKVRQKDEQTIKKQVVGAKKISKEEKDLAKFKDATSKENLKDIKLSQKAKEASINKTKSLEAARIKQAINNQNILSNKKAKDSAEVFNQVIKEKDLAAKSLKFKVDRERENFIKSKQHKAKLRDLGKKEAIRADAQAKKELANRLKVFKAEKANQASKLKAEKANQASIEKSSALSKKADDARGKSLDKLKMKAQQLEETIRLSSGFRRLPQAQQRRFEPQFAQARHSMEGGGGNREFRKLSSDVREFKRSLVGLQTVQMGLTDSTKNMVRSYASLFALLEGTRAIERVGMDFQGMRIGMLAVSGDAKKTADNLKFIQGQADRLGFSVSQGSKAFVKLYAAAEGKATHKEIKDSFTSIMEASTVFQLSADDTIGTIKAIQQMFSKTGIRAEEFKEQLGDRIPIAMRALEKSTGKTSKELLKMMELGKLDTKFIVPFVKALGEIADNGNAVAKAIQTARTQKARFVNESAKAADTIFKSGFEKGIKDIYEELTKQLKGSGKSLEDVGDLYGKLFKVIRAGIKLAVPALKVLISVFNGVSDAVETSAKGWVMLFDLMERKTPVLSGWVKGIGLAALAFRTLTGRIMLALGAVQEIVSLFDDRLIGQLEISMGKQINIGKGTTSEFTKKDGKFFATKDSEKKFTLEGGGELFSKLTESSTGVITAFVVVTASLWGFKKVIGAVVSTLGIFKKGVGTAGKMFGAFKKVPPAATKAATSLGSLPRLVAGITGYIAGRAAIDQVKESTGFDIDKHAQEFFRKLRPSVFSAQVAANQSSARLENMRRFTILEEKQERGGKLSGQEKLQLGLLRSAAGLSDERVLPLIPNSPLLTAATTTQQINQQTSQQISKEIVLSGLEINVNMTEGMNPHEAGMEVGNGIMQQLSSQLSSIVAGGN